MQDIWQNFVEEKTTAIEDIADIDINNLSVISPLSNFALLTVRGKDRHSFLHGQFINDLNRIETSGAQLTAWCNPKGQLISNFIIINTGISYLLIFKKELKEVVCKRLNMFVMRSDVTIEDITRSSPIIGISNIDKLSALISDVSNIAGEVQAVDGLVLICHPDNSGRHLITGSIDALINKLPEINKSLASSSVWELLDILVGLPWITSTTQEQYLPQMLNLDVLKSLSYKKGCYPGQEVIARLHYRGEVKKRLQLIKSTSRLTVGDDIFLDTSSIKAGNVVNSAMHPDGNFYGLAVIELDKLTEKLLVDNIRITILDLPYSVDS